MKMRTKLIILFICTTICARATADSSDAAITGDGHMDNQNDALEATTPLGAESDRAATPGDESGIAAAPGVASATDPSITTATIPLGAATVTAPGQGDEKFVSMLSSSFPAMTNTESIFSSSSVNGIIITVLIAVLVPLLFRYFNDRKNKQEKDEEDIKERQRRERLNASRLLQGSLPNDLVLLETLEESKIGETKVSETTKSDSQRNKDMDRTDSQVMYEDNEAAKSDSKEKDGSNRSENDETRVHEENKEEANDKSNKSENEKDSSTGKQQITPLKLSSSSPTKKKKTAIAATMKAPPPPPPMQHSSNASLPKEASSQLFKCGFYHWMDTECSLFRVYCRGRTDGVEVVPPYNPSSRRGLVSVHVEVINRRKNSNNSDENSIRVYWVDYKGKEDFKGLIRPNETWTQQTWMEHPWVFRTATGDQCSKDTVLLHYIPYRIIPTTHLVHTTNIDDANQGVHAFEIHDANPNVWGGSGQIYSCELLDKVMPFPAQDHFTSRQAALDWTFHHCLRMDWLGWNVLTKYLSKIVEPSAADSSNENNNDNRKYRQIRIGNPHFSTSIWNTPARGLLLAVGFVEHVGYAEYGSPEPLTEEMKNRIRNLLVQVERWKQQVDLPTRTQLEQPEGADGYGAAGFGRAGGMNDRQ